MMEKAGHENPPSEQPGYQQQQQQQIQQHQQSPPSYTQQPLNVGQPQVYQQHGGYVQQGYGATSGQGVVLVQPQPTALYVPIVHQPSDYMVPSIFACLCCF
ncbi:hypothetical protein DPMN_104472 [Dreissena polymorpha]|uniref:Uncharacterized protein n=1 Tax=Dreissena polymorpha TaxID=45954 RepID=A0A9D4HBP4_DREPO|nr:hypothetical protein DPMN_104472 [Dreissena polymorpha]